MTGGIAARRIWNRTTSRVGTERLTFFGYTGRRILRLYHLYRVVIGLVLVLLISSDLHNDLMRMINPAAFYYGAWLYLILNIFAAVLLQNPKRELPVLALALVDVPLLAALFSRRHGAHLPDVLPQPKRQRGEQSVCTGRRTWHAVLRCRVAGAGPDQTTSG